MLRQKRKILQVVAKRWETKHEWGLDRKLCIYLPCTARRSKKIQVPAGSRTRAARRAGKGKRGFQPGLFCSTHCGLQYRSCQHHPSTAAPRVEPEPPVTSCQHLAGGSASLPQHLSWEFKVLGVMGLVFVFLCFLYSLLKTRCSSAKKDYYISLHIINSYDAKTDICTFMELSPSHLNLLMPCWTIHRRKCSMTSPVF